MSGTKISSFSLIFHGGTIIDWIYTGNSEEKLGEAAAAAVKRIYLDERIAKNAKKAGAKLIESFEVTKNSTHFDKQSGLWTVTSAEVLLL